MNATQLGKFQGMLESQRSELEEIIRHNDEQLRRQLNLAESSEGHVDYNHPADMVAGDPDYEKELTLLERERRELTAVDEALERIQKREYGTCVECGEEIPLRRLEAIPFAKYCISCQKLLAETGH